MDMSEWGRIQVEELCQRGAFHKQRSQAEPRPGRRLNKKDLVR
jgi:hypothetical protein